MMIVIIVYKNTTKNIRYHWNLRAWCWNGDKKIFLDDKRRIFKTCIPHCVRIDWKLSFVKTYTNDSFLMNWNVLIQVFLFAYFCWRYTQIWEFELQFNFSAWSWIRSFSINCNTNPTTVILLRTKSEVVLFSCHFYFSFICKKSLLYDTMNLRLLLIHENII